MTAKQAALNNFRVRSTEGRYLPSSFTDQHKMVNPEVEGLTNPHANVKVSEFSIKDKPFTRVKSGDAAHEISQVMQAAAKSQREATSHMSKLNNLGVQPPKVIPNPKIISTSKMSGVDIPHLQAFMSSLKHASGNHSSSTHGLKINH